jgi:hypothetical protein
MFDQFSLIPVLNCPMWLAPPDPPPFTAHPFTPHVHIILAENYNHHKTVWCIECYKANFYYLDFAKYKSGHLKIRTKFHADFLFNEVQPARRSAQLWILPWAGRGEGGGRQTPSFNCISFFCPYIH